ncbi:MAG: hypothetical protein FJ276_24500 [Planctomycetes bacterium]|nr:hypothetical protein [Planctomycetota bacterium]
MQSQQDTDGLNLGFWSLVRLIWISKIEGNVKVVGNLYVNIPYVVRSLVIGLYIASHTEWQPDMTILDAAWSVVLDIGTVAMFIVPLIILMESVVIALWRRRPI